MNEQISAVQRMQDYIREHINEEITMSALSKVSLFSPWHSYRLFRQYTNLTPTDYIRRLRLSESAIKLKNENCLFSNYYLYWADDCLYASLLPCPIPDCSCLVSQLPLEWGRIVRNSPAGLGLQRHRESRRQTVSWDPLRAPHCRCRYCFQTSVSRTCRGGKREEMRRGLRGDAHTISAGPHEVCCARGHVAKGAGARDVIR